MAGIVAGSIGALVGVAAITAAAFMGYRHYKAKRKLN